MNNVAATDNKNTSLDQISSLIINLNSKLRNFLVIDKHSNLIGRVKDVILDSNRQISFIITESDHLESRLFILRGQLVQKIDSSAHCLILIVDKSQLEYLPEYIEREIGTEIEDKILENTSGNLTVDNSLQNSSMPDTSSVNQTNNFAVDSTEEVAHEDIIRLLGERLIVDRSKRKVGEVVVRKEIETRMVTVPVRHERLIVEQVSPEYKELANIYLGGEEVVGVEPTLGEKVESTDFNGALTVSGEFSSPKIASLLLNAIALERNNGCKRVKITIAVEDEQHQQKYQEWFARTSIKGE